MTGASAGAPTLALVLAVAMLGHVIWTTDRLTSLAPVTAAARTPARPAAQPGPVATSPSRLRPESMTGADAAGMRHQGGPPISPRLAACCEIAMGLTMGYMLILML